MSVFITSNYRIRFLIPWEQDSIIESTRNLAYRGIKSKKN